MTGHYFERQGETSYAPTELTSGAWSTSEQHISPMNGLILHALERRLAERGDDGLAVSRLSVDILGVLTMDPFTIDIEVVRPGRTIELLEAVVTSNGRPAVRARIWRTAVQDTAEVAGGEAAPLPDPETLKPWDMTGVWPGGYVASLDVRQVGAAEPGRARAWATTAASLVADEPSSDLARVIGLVDTANGLAVRRPPEEWLFPNVDLTVHLFRTPTGPWLGLDTTVVFGPGGLGTTASALHDEAGHFGFAHQALTLRARR